MNTPDIHLYDADIEAAVVGACLIDPEAIFYVTSLLQVSDFHDGKYQKVFASMLSVAGRGDVLDVLTVATELEKHKHLANVGGAAFLSELIASTPSSAHAPSYANTVADYARRRDMVRTASKLVQQTYNTKAPTDNTITWAV